MKDIIPAKKESPLLGLTGLGGGVGSKVVAGGAAGKDFYTLNIIKTANAAFTVLGNVSNFA